MATAVNIAPTATDSVTPNTVPAPPVVETEGKVGTRRGTHPVRTYVFRDGGCEEGVAIEKLPALVRSSRNLAWVDLSEYARSDFEVLANALKLHPVTVRATLADWERPRVDVFPDYFYISVTVLRANQDRRRLVAGELNVMVGPNFLVTAHKLPLPFGDKILERLKQSPEVATLHSAYALYIILEELVEHYEGLFEHVDEEIERAEEAALTESSDAFLEDLLALKRYIFVMGRFAEQHRSVFSVLTRPDFTKVSGENIEPYFRDLQENLARLIDKLTAARESVTDAFDIYVSQVSHRTSELIRVLTLISIIVLPASLVTSFFATGFTWTLALRSFPAFLIMLVLLVALPTSILLFIRARKLV
ncbi:MAG: magnesium/cobalt transporter CorA [Candidatus Dormibacteria bacterium]